MFADKKTSERYRIFCGDYESEIVYTSTRSSTYSYKSMYNVDKRIVLMMKESFGPLEVISWFACLHTLDSFLLGSLALYILAISSKTHSSKSSLTILQHEMVTFLDWSLPVTASTSDRKQCSSFQFDSGFSLKIFTLFTFGNTSLK